MKSSTIIFNYTTKTGKTAGQTKTRKVLVMQDNGTQISGFDLNLLPWYEKIILPIQMRNHTVTAGPTNGQGHIKGYNKLKKAWRNFDKSGMTFTN